MKRGELAKKKRKGCLTALLVVWAVFIVKVIAVLNPGFPEAWRMVEAGQIAGFAYIWLLVFLVLLCCFVLWRIVPKGYFRKKKPETSRPAGEWAVSIPTHENPVVVGNPFRGIFIAGAAGSGKSESVAVPLLLEFIRKGFAGIVYDFKFPALDNGTFTSIVLRTANIPAFIVYPFDTLYHSFLIYSKPFRRSMYILFSRASHPAASAVSSAAKFSLLASSAMVISPVSPNFSKMIPALNPIFVFSMIKFIFMYQKYVYILLFKTCRNTNLNSPPLLEKINNLYIKLFSSSKWNDYFRGY